MLGMKIKRVNQSQINQIALSLSDGTRMTGRCCICGRKVFSSHSIYCLRCFEFVRCMNQRGVHPVAVKRILRHVHQNGFVCEYTGIELDMKNPKSGWYFEFDHRIPGDDKTVTLTFALFNEMKSVLALNELKTFVKSLADFWQTGAPVKKIRLRYWQQRGPHLKMILLNLARILKKGKV
jgi:hypothetical protein